MFSSKSKNTFLSFDRFKEVIDSCNNEFELQLEGGEPLLHPNLFLFLEYARYTNKCSKIIITTNGIILDKLINKLVEFTASSKIKMLIKHSINFHLEKINSNIYKKCRNFYTATEFVDNFDVRFNVRVESDNDPIISKLKEFKIYDQSDIYQFQSYGRYLGKSNYSKPVIVQNIDEWYIYSSDGICFNQDLVARSNHEEIIK